MSKAQDVVAGLFEGATPQRMAADTFPTCLLAASRSSTHPACGHRIFPAVGGFLRSKSQLIGISAALLVQGGKRSETLKMEGAGDSSMA